MAPTGNKYAEKWTLPRTLEALQAIEHISFSNDCYYLGHALSVAGYYDDIWAYWRRKWRHRYEIIGMMKQIMQRFEVRIFDKMVRREIPERVGMFALKHHYGWGREPKEDAPFEDISEVDRELIPDPAAADEPAQATDTASEPAPVTEPAPMTGREFMLHKKKEYNQAHPTQQILTDAAYFDGPPPPGLPAILFDGGYFLKC